MFRLTHSIAILCILLSLLFLHLPVVYADATSLTTSLTISPTVMKIHASAPSIVNESLTITNNGNDVTNLEIQTRFFRDAGRDDGTISYIDQNDLKDMKNYQDFSKTVTIIDPEDTTIPLTSISLGPKQKKTLSIQIKIANNALPSDYYFSIVFLTETNRPPDATDRTSNSTIQSGIAMHVLLSIGQSQAPDGAWQNNQEAYIADFSLPFYIESGPAPFTVRIANVGSRFVTPKGAIFITNMFGQTIGRVDLAPASILSSSIRKIPDLTQFTKQGITADTSHVVWPEKVLFGFYTATLSLSLFPSDHVVLKTIHFIAFPIHVLVGSVIALIVLIIVIIRVVKRLT